VEEGGKEERKGRDVKERKREGEGKGRGREGRGGARSPQIF